MREPAPPITSVLVGENQNGQVKLCKQTQDVAQQLDEANKAMIQQTEKHTSASVVNLC